MNITDLGKKILFVQWLENLNKKALLRIWLYLLKTYFRVEVEGLENVPSQGGALIIPNHSGFNGADAVMLAFVLKRETRRRARILAHRAFFDFSERLKALAEEAGLRRATLKEGIEVLKKGNLLILFPEGEAGNFKPTMKRYHLQEFRSGFLKMSLDAQAPMIPCLIIGAEESSFNIGNIDLSGVFRNFRIPMPLNFIPLPSKWKIVFLPALPPIQRREDFSKQAHHIRLLLQRELNQQVRSRRFVYARPIKKWLRPWWGLRPRRIRRKS